MGGRLILDGDADRAPVRIGVPQAYEHAGAHAAMGVMTALYARPALGRGQHVDVSVQAAIAWTLMNAPAWWDLLHENQARGGAVRPYPNTTAPLPHRQVWPCKDGYVYYLIQGGSQAGAAASTRRLVERIDRDGLANGLRDIDWTQFDFRFIDHAVLHHVTEAVGRFFLTKTKAELTDIAVASGVRIAPLNAVDEILADEQLAARDFWRHLDHPELGQSITYPGQAVKMSETPWALRRRAPLLGEHNLEVYGEIGLTADDLGRLRGAGVI
jgi:benzylsuccinate CoA-transferase BbsE subunit